MAHGPRVKWLEDRVSAWSIFPSLALGPGQQTTRWWAPCTVDIIPCDWPEECPSLHSYRLHRLSLLTPDTGQSWAQKPCAWEADIYCLYPPVTAPPQLQPGQRRVWRAAPVGPTCMCPWAWLLLRHNSSYPSKRRRPKRNYFFPLSYFLNVTLIK